MPERFRALEGRSYPHLGDAKQAIRQALLPELDVYSLDFEAYVVGDFDRGMLGSATGHYVRDNSEAPYSPAGLIVQDVQTRRLHYPHTVTACCRDVQISTEALSASSAPVLSLPLNTASWLP